MADQNAALVNFVAGETSPKSRGRFDRPWYNASCEKMLNFIPDVQGPARFRTGFKVAALTRGGALPRMAPFPVNADLAYMVEFTNQIARFYNPDGSLVKYEKFAVSGIGAGGGGQVVVTVASTTGISDGDEVILTGIVGMPAINDVVWVVGSSTATTFELTHAVTGANITYADWGTYSSGGTVYLVAAVTTPYREEDLVTLQWATSGNEMTITSPRWAPRTLTAGASDTFVLVAETRTNDPFVAGSALSLTGISLGAVTIIKFAAGTGIVYGAKYDFAAITGTTELNSQSYRLTSDLHGASLPSGYGGVSWGVLEDDDGDPVDGSAWTPWVSGGTATQQADNPLGVCYYEGRKVYLGTDRRPSTLFFSRGPSTSTGASRYADFTGGTNADDAVFFTLAPNSGQVDYIVWGYATPDYLYIGTFGGPFRVSGGGVETPVTPSSVNAKQIDAYGCEVAPPAGASGGRVFYIQRGGVALRDAILDPDTITPVSRDLTLNAEQVAYSPLTRVALQSGRSDTVWVLRTDGQLAGLTVHGPENVTGWHRHKIGSDVGLAYDEGANLLRSASFVDIQVMPRPTLGDQLWVATKRALGGNIRHYIEVGTDPVDFLDRDDFYETRKIFGDTDDDIPDTDLARFWGSVYRRQGEYHHLDTSFVYDGSRRGVDASVRIKENILSSGAEGVGDTIYLDVIDADENRVANFLESSDVGKEIWVKPDRATGQHGGRFLITAVDVAGGTATCTVLVPFSRTHPAVFGTPTAAGDWYFATDTFYGMYYLQEVDIPIRVVADGAVIPATTGHVDGGRDVSAIGAISIDRSAAVARMGARYKGFIKTQNLELAAPVGGPSQSKPRNIVEMGIRFLHTLGVKFGTDIYDLDQVDFAQDGDPMDRPTPVFSGVKKLHHSDKWSIDGAGKHIYIQQDLPLPCIVESIDVEFEVGDR